MLGHGIARGSGGSHTHHRYGRAEWQQVVELLQSNAFKHALVYHEGLQQHRVHSKYVCKCIYKELL